MIKPPAVLMAIFYLLFTIFVKYKIIHFRFFTNFLVAIQSCKHGTELGGLDLCRFYGGSKRLESCPVDSFQRGTGGSPEQESRLTEWNSSKSGATEQMIVSFIPRASCFFFFGLCIPWIKYLPTAFRRMRFVPRWKKGLSVSAQASSFSAFSVSARYFSSFRFTRCSALSMDFT